jgi:hypothetical protein
LRNWINSFRHLSKFKRFSLFSIVSSLLLFDDISCCNQGSSKEKTRRRRRRKNLFSFFLVAWPKFFSFNIFFIKKKLLFQIFLTFYDNKNVTLYLFFFLFLLLLLLLIYAGYMR